VWARWPVGGYVKLLNSRIEPVFSDNLSFCFDKQAIWKRIVILASGGAANFVIALIALYIYFFTGFVQMAPVIAKVEKSSVAFEAGIGAGDRFVSVNGRKTPSWRAVSMQLVMHLGRRDVAVNIQDTAGKTIETTLDLSKWEYKQRINALFAGLGMYPDTSQSHLHDITGKSYLSAFYKACEEVINTVIFLLVMLKQLFSGSIPFAALLGPVGLFDEIIASFSQGFSAFMFLIANLSIAVGLINLFPVPGLDGGSILYALVEKIRGKPVSLALEVLLHRLALIFFCVALFNLLMNDLQRYVQ
jgi:regulator of sigma E protease